MLKKLKKIKKRYWIIAGILLLVIVLLVIRNNNQDNYSRYTVTETTVSDELLLAGTIDATKRVDLGFASSGRVKGVYFTTGDTVRKGQVIAEIEQNRLAADLTQARANLTLTQVDTSIDINSAEDSYETLLAEQNQLVESAYQALISGDLRAYADDETSREAEAPVISGTYSGTEQGEYIIEAYSSSTSSGYSFRLSGLGSGNYSAQEFQPGKLGEDGLFIQFNEGDKYNNTTWIVPVPNVRSSTYITRKNAYDNVIKTRERVISDARNNLERNTATVDGTITRNDARREQAAAQVNAVYAQLGDGTIRAPFDGIIAKNNLEVGEIVNAFTTEVVMFGSEQKQLDLNTPEIYINKIKVGDEVSIVLDAYEDTPFTGTIKFIDFIDTEVNGVPVYQTDILINDKDERIRVGMNAKARIISERREGVLAVPSHFIKEDEQGASYVLILNNKEGKESIEKRIIETGLRGNDGLVEITSGLNTGMIIAVENK